MRGGELIIFSAHWASADYMRHSDVPIPSVYSVIHNDTICVYFTIDHEVLTYSQMRLFPSNYDCSWVDACLYTIQYPLKPANHTHACLCADFPGEDQKGGIYLCRLPVYGCGGRLAVHQRPPTNYHAHSNRLHISLRVQPVHHYASMAHHGIRLVSCEFFW